MHKNWPNTSPEWFPIQFCIIELWGIVDSGWDNEALESEVCPKGIDLDHLITAGEVISDC